VMNPVTGTRSTERSRDGRIACARPTQYPLPNYSAQIRISVVPEVSAIGEQPVRRGNAIGKAKMCHESQHASKSNKDLT
jgi:hypothetical protein